MACAPPTGCTSSTPARAAAARMPDAPFEGCGVLTQGGVAPLLDVGQDLPHRLNRRSTTQVGAGQPVPDVEAGTTKVEPGEHANDGRPVPCAPPGVDRITWRPQAS